MTYKEMSTPHKQILFWGQHHGHDPSFKFGGLFDAGKFLSTFRNILKQLPPAIGQGNFTAPENHRNLDLVLFVDKPLNVIQFGVQVMFARFRPDLDFFYLKRTLLFFGFLLFLGLLVFVTAIVHYFADRWIRVGRNLHQIQPVVAGDGKRFICRYDTQLFPVRINDPDFFGPDIFFDIGSVLTLRSVCSFWKYYALTSLSGLTGNGTC